MRGLYPNLVSKYGSWLAAFTLVGVVTLLTVGATSPARALPSFARQTGQPCGTCHTDYPALTPYGRRFKLLGYTPGGGQFRTTPFSSNAAIDARAEYDKLRAYAGATAGTPAAGSTTSDDSKEWVPPISMMAIVVFVCAS